MYAIQVDAEEEENSDENNSDESFEISSDESESENGQSTSTKQEYSDQNDGPSTSKRRRKTVSKRFDSDNRGWNRLEEMHLLDAFKDYGTGYLQAICSKVPTKNTNEIKEYMERKRKGAVTNLRAGVSEENEATIDKWISHLCKLSPSDDYKCMYVARALKYIALFEERQPENQNKDGVNLQDCYLILSSLLSGEGPKYTNRYTSYYMHSVIQEFAKYMKLFNSSEELKYLKSTSKPPVSCYGKKAKVTPNQQKKSVSTEDYVLNPLRLPKGVLKLDD